MTQIGTVSEVGRLLLKNVVHADGSVRAQLVNPEDLLGRVIDALASIGHGPFVCNTSLNGPQEPIVNTANDALTSARRLSLDAILLEDELILA